ncbi:uncharacterized protein [Triticum aestivum]|nr:uncharacterized protein LOC123112371 [Triticum aestivum]
MEEEGTKKAVLFRLFGVEVRGAEEDDDAEPMELKKSTSMPNLACASTDPFLLPGEASNDKGYASDDGELAPTPHLKRRRRKAQERMKVNAIVLHLDHTRDSVDRGGAQEVPGQWGVERHLQELRHHQDGHAGGQPRPEVLPPADQPRQEEAPGQPLRRRHPRFPQL